MTPLVFERPLPTVDDALERRRFLVGGLGLTAALAGCGSQSERSSGGSAAAETDTVPLVNEFGTFDIPTSPTSLVVFEGRRDLETALSLGWEPTAIGDNAVGEDGRAAPFIDFDLTGLPTFTPSEPEVEKIASFHPDLIIGRSSQLKPVSEQLASVSPLMTVGDPGTPWRSELEDLAATFHAEATVDALLRDYDALRSEIKDRHSAALDGARVAYLVPDKETVTISHPDGFALQGNVLNDLGGQPLSFYQDVPVDEPDRLSLENLDQFAEADAILVIGRIHNVEEDLAQLETNGLWRKLPAVKKGHIVTTDARTSYGSVFAATECLRLWDKVYGTLA